MPSEWGTLNPVTFRTEDVRDFVADLAKFENDRKAGLLLFSN